MGFFESKQDTKKHDKSVQPTPSPDPTPPTKSGSFNGTLVGKTMKIDGDLTGNEDVLVEGTVVGKLTSQESVIVGPSGIVRAAVHCKGITVRGEVVGNVAAKDRVIIESTGKLKGDISTKSLTIEPGGFFEGFSRMLQDTPRPADEKKGQQPEQKTDQKPEKNHGKPSQK